VVFAGRKVPIPRPRVRAKGAGELPLDSYRLFQQDGRRQRAVARKLIRQVSTREYAGAIDECLDGYGITKSSISRHCKVATAAELAQLCQCPTSPLNKSSGAKCAHPVCCSSRMPRSLPAVMGLWW